MDVKRITPEETKALLDSGAGYVYVDVRTVEEFSAEHVTGAKNVPFMERNPSYGGMMVNPQFAQVMESAFGKDAKLICGCQRGGRSFKAVQTLQAAGFQDVVDMRGGYDGELDPSGRMIFLGWAPRGLPTCSDSAPEDCYEQLQSGLSQSKG